MAGRINSPLTPIEIKYLEGFGGIIQEELAKSPLMQMCLKDGVKVENGNLIFFKAGANENLAAVRSKVDVNKYSNKYGQIDAPINMEFSTESILLSATEFIQFENGALDIQAFRVKGQKVAKLLARVIMEVWVSGKLEDGTVVGDNPTTGTGEMPKIDFAFKTDIATNTDEEVAEEFGKFRTIFVKSVQTIKRYGYANLDGKNEIDYFRTGTEVSNNTHKVITSWDFAERYRKWVAVKNHNEFGILKDNSYGKLAGFDLYEDIFLPFAGTKTKGIISKGQFDNDDTLTVDDGDRRIEFMFIKQNCLVKFNVWDETYAVSPDRSPKSRLVGFNGKLGVMTINIDECFYVDSSAKGEEVKKQLSTVLTVNELGEIVDNEVATITAKINELNKGAVGNYSLGTPTETSVSATGTGEYEGTVEVSFIITPAEETKNKTKQNQKNK